MQSQLEKIQTELEGMSVTATSGGGMVTVEADGTGAEPASADTPPKKPAADVEKQAALKEQALADTGVQALLEVFPAEIRDVEEM